MSPAVLIAILIACVAAGIVTQRLGSTEAPARRRPDKSPAKPGAKKPAKPSATKGYVFALRDGSRAALLPFGHVQGNGAPAARLGQMLDADRVLVEHARGIAIDLRRLVRVMPHVINELRLSAMSAASALEGAPIEVSVDRRSPLARRHVLAALRARHHRAVRPAEHVPRTDPSCAGHGRPCRRARSQARSGSDPR